MKKYFIVTDVHGFYDILKETLDKKGFDINNPNHIFISLGDLFDRGTQAKECLEFVMSIPKKRRILIRGNHEDLFEAAIKAQELESYDYHNGLDKTITSLTNLFVPPYGHMLDEVKNEIFNKLKHNKLLKEYFKSLVNYAEIGNNIFVHGWLPCKRISGCTNYYEFNWHWREVATESDWQKARWVNGMDAWRFYVKEPGKTIYCGHYNCSWGWANIDQKRKEFPTKNLVDWEKSFEPYKRKGIVALDACTAYSGLMNCEVIEEGE